MLPPYWRMNMNFDHDDFDFGNQQNSNQAWQNDEYEIPDAPDSWSINDFDDLVGYSDFE